MREGEDQERARNQPSGLGPADLEARRNAGGPGEREQPILMSATSVREILAGRMTQARRIVKGLVDGARYYGPDRDGLHLFVKHCAYGKRACPYGVRGDLLWVRETHAIVPRTAYVRSEGVQQTLRPNDNHDAAVYREGWERSKPGRWRPSIHMPRWASRITLRITDVRVERLNEISEADAAAEGVADLLAPVIAYSQLWDDINGPGSWDANPWVWVVSFEVVRPPVTTASRSEQSARPTDQARNEHLPLSPDQTPPEGG